MGSKLEPGWISAIPIDLERFHVDPTIFRSSFFSRASSISSFLFPKRPPIVGHLDRDTRGTETLSRVGRYTVDDEHETTKSRKNPRTERRERVERFQGSLSFKFQASRSFGTVHDTGTPRGGRTILVATLSA